MWKKRETKLKGIRDKYFRIETNIINEFYTKRNHKINQALIKSGITGS